MKNKTKEFVVYKITNIDSGKAYIGITGDYKSRMRNHFNANKCCQYLHRSIKKHGKEKFTHEIICYCNSWNMLCKMEIEFIKLYNTKVTNGYNLTDGGEGIDGYKMSKEARKKISIALKNPSEETRKKISKVHKNKMVSKETRKKLSIAHQNPSKRIRKKMSDVQKIFSVDQILEIRKLLKNGLLQKDIAKKFNVHRTTISDIKTGRHYSEMQTPRINLKNLPKGNHKFSKNQILEMRKMLSKGFSQKIIAKKFNTHQTTISSIKQNKVYADVQLPEKEI